jgi:hypothetical protein
MHAVTATREDRSIYLFIPPGILRLAYHNNNTMAASFTYRLPGDDFSLFFEGVWKRTVVRQLRFGHEFPSLPATKINRTIVIRKVSNAVPEPGTEFLDWRIGSSADDVKPYLSMQLVHDEEEGVSHINWQHQGISCRGIYHYQAAMGSFTTQDKSFVQTVSLRPLDSNTVGICITESDGSSAQQAICSYGNMIRVSK